MFIIPQRKKELTRYFEQGSFEVRFLLKSKEILLNILMPILVYICVCLLHVFTGVHLKLKKKQKTLRVNQIENPLC